MPWGAGCIASRIGWPCRPRSIARGSIFERTASDDLPTLVAVGESPSDDDWRIPLHEEVARLPERFRLPVVLCYLEGKTHAQAALELRWREATLRRRLADARDLLRSRLTRRGVAVSTGALAAALAREASARSRPAGSMPWPARCTISATAARLAETVVRSMLVGQIQGLATVVITLVAASLVAAHLVPTAGAARQRRPRSVEPSTIAPSPPAQARNAERLH